MKKKLIIAIAAVLVTGAGIIYAVSTGYVQLGAPTQEEIDSSVSEAADVAAQKAAEEMRVSSAAQEQALAELEAQVEQLEKELQKPSESTTSVPPEASTTSVPAVPSSVAPQSNSAAMTMSAQASSSTAPAKATKAENAGTVFEGYTVTVTDKNTPAVMAGGTDRPITKLYFFDANGDTLGSISGTAYNSIMDKYKTADTWEAPSANGAWEFWFAEEFNNYRGLSGNNLNRPDEGSASNKSSNESADIDENIQKVISLTNAERENAGLHVLETDSSLMELAQIRAEELATQYSHSRPDGTTVVDLGYGENAGAKSSASAQVNSWMSSDGHKTNILRDKYNHIGVGCYQSDNGKLYWIQIFSR